MAKAAGGWPAPMPKDVLFFPKWLCDLAREQFAGFLILEQRQIPPIGQSGMAKGTKGKMNGGNKEFTVRGGKGAGTGGEKPDAISGPKRKGDSRSKSSMRPITPSKAY